MNGAQALRTIMFAAPAEMALVRRDAVAAALLAQAARAAADSPAEEPLREAATICRTLDLADVGPEASAARKVALALTRIALHEAGEAGL